MNYILLVLVLGLVGFAQSQSNPPIESEANICTGHSNNTRIRDYSNCEKYFTCINGKPVPDQCFFGAKFDPIALECNFRSFECFSCPEEHYFIDLPVDYECLQFIRCFDGTAVQHTCSDGLLFDPVREQCNVSEDVVCACPNDDIPGHPFFVRNWFDCANYHVCVKGDKHEFDCAKGLNFNLDSRQCDLASNVDCNSTSTNWIFNELNNTPVHHKVSVL